MGNVDLGKRNQVGGCDDVDLPVGGAGNEVFLVGGYGAAGNPPIAGKLALHTDGAAGTLADLDLPVGIGGEQLGSPVQEPQSPDLAALGTRAALPDSPRSSPRGSRRQHRRPKQGTCRTDRTRPR